MEMTVQHMRLLREVASRGTIAAAAGALGYTPSAVSQQLTGLEKTTGVAVLERVGRNVRLTDAGRVLVRHAGDLLAGLEAAQVAMEQVNSEVRGQLELAVYESVASTLLPPLLDRLAERYPDLTLRTRQLEPDPAIAAVAAGDIDLAFTIDYADAPAVKPGQVVREMVLEDSYFLVVAEDDPLTGPVVDLSAAADRRFIASPTHVSCGRCVLMACRSAGFEPDVVHQLDDYPAALHLVAAGQGVALIPRLGLIHMPAGLRPLTLANPVCRQVQVAFRPTSAGRPAIGAVQEALREVAADVQAPLGLQL